jgi:hypothetical protein
VAFVNTRLRVFLSVVSLIFAGLLAVQLASALLRPGDPPAPSAVHQQAVDRPADPPAANPPRTPPGRGLIRSSAQWAAKAG